MEYTIGIDLGGTNIKVLAIDPSGSILYENCCATQPLKDPQETWSGRVLSMLENAELHMGKPAKYLGIAAPGMTDLKKRKIVSLPGRLQGLEGLDWTRFLNREKPVPVLNDAVAALHGEIWMGSAKSYNNVIFLTLGTGVGGAFSIDGKVIEGSIGRAGHFGHTCLNPEMPLDIKNCPGSIELLIGECTIKERTGGRFNSTEELVAAYKAGDRLGTEVWLRSMYHLACSITSFINILDPEIVLIGGGISKAKEALLLPVRERLHTIEWRPVGHRVPIEIAKLGNKAGAIGAARFAMLEGERSELLTESLLK